MAPAVTMEIFIKPQEVQPSAAASAVGYKGLTMSVMNPIYCKPYIHYDVLQTI